MIVYPIGIGQTGMHTPLEVTSVSQKIPNPTRTPTANIRKRYQSWRDAACGGAGRA